MAIWGNITYGPSLASFENIRDHTRRVAQYVVNRWPVFYGWGIGETGHHAQGRAFDFMVLTADQSDLQPQMGSEIAAFLHHRREDLGVRYIIYNRRIVSGNSDPPWIWRDYHGSNPHVDHVHVSFLDHPPPLQLPGGYPVEDDMPTPADLWHHHVSINRDKHSDLGYSRDEYRAEQLLADSSHRSRAAARGVGQLANLVRDSVADRPQEIRDAVDKGTERILDALDLDEPNGEDIAGLDAVVDAWQDPGQSKAIHREAQDWLAEHWPTLFDAMVKLAGPPVELDNEEEDA